MKTASEMRKLADSYRQHMQNKKREEARAFLNEKYMPVIEMSAEVGEFETPWLNLPTVEQADWKEVAIFLSQLGYNWETSKGRVSISWGL